VAAADETLNYLGGMASSCHKIHPDHRVVGKLSAWGCEYQCAIVGVRVRCSDYPMEAKHTLPRMITRGCFGQQ